ncbi:MAG: hypothetical protein GY938_30815 [Ketobacter sp.]|nr:hypothetical protein [Ketobacter sp.]
MGMETRCHNLSHLMPKRPRTAKTTTKDKHRNEITRLVKNMLLSDDGSAADVGVALGAIGDEQWMTEQRKKCGNLADFMDLAKQRANVALVVAAVKEAKGYNYVETTQEFIPVVDDDGNPTGEEVPGKIKRTTKWSKGDPGLLKFITSSRMPNQFNEVKKIQIEKRSIEIKGDAEAEIRQFYGKMLQEFGGEQDAEFVESSGAQETER